MGRRRGVKRKLPAIKVLPFNSSSSSSTYSKRTIALTTPDVVNADRNDSEDDDFVEPVSVQPLILHINDGNEIDDEEDFEDDQGGLSQYRKKQQRAAGKTFGCNATGIC